MPKVAAIDPQLLVNTPRVARSSSAIKGIDHAAEGMRAPRPPTIRAQSSPPRAWGDSLPRAGEMAGRSRCVAEALQSGEVTSR
ncbi:hypothetical protein ACTMU2_26820 [Cupriavidus basilensis]